jgi:hypothetical protein
MEAHMLFKHLMSLVFILSAQLFSQNMMVKDEDENVLMMVEDQGSTAKLSVKGELISSSSTDVRHTAIHSNAENSIAGFAAYGDPGSGGAEISGGFMMAAAKGTMKHLSSINDNDAYIAVRHANFNFHIGYLSPIVTIKSSNRCVGIGTTTPYYDLHVLNSEDASIFLGSSTNSRHVRIGTNQGGIAPFIEFSDGDPNRLWQCYLVSADDRFGIGHPGELEKFTILSDGKVGIGTSSPGSFLLAVNGDAAKPSGGHWASYSDGRLKTAGTDYVYGLNEICLLSPLKYRYSETNELGLPSEPEHVGLIAQDVAGVIPDAVTTNSNGYLMIDQDPIMWAMLNAIKELKAENDSLKTVVEKRLKMLESKINENFE